MTRARQEWLILACGWAGVVVVAYAKGWTYALA